MCVFILLSFFFLSIVYSLNPEPRFEDITSVYGITDRVFTIDKVTGFVYEIFINNGTVGRFVFDFYFCFFKTNCSSVFVLTLLVFSIFHRFSLNLIISEHSICLRKSKIMMATLYLMEVVVIVRFLLCVGFFSILLKRLSFVSHRQNSPH